MRSDQSGQSRGQSRQSVSHGCGCGCAHACHCLHIATPCMHACSEGCAPRPTPPRAAPIGVQASRRSTWTSGSSLSSTAACMHACGPGRAAGPLPGGPRAYPALHACMHAAVRITAPRAERHGSLGRPPPPSRGGLTSYASPYCSMNAALIASALARWPPPVLDIRMRTRFFFLPPLPARARASRATDVPRAHVAGGCAMQHHAWPPGPLHPLARCMHACRPAAWLPQSPCCSRCAQADAYVVVERVQCNMLWQDLHVCTHPAPCHVDVRPPLGASPAALQLPPGAVQTAFAGPLDPSCVCTQQRQGNCLLCRPINTRGAGCCQLQLTTPDTYKGPSPDADAQASSSKTFRQNVDVLRWA